MKRYRVLGIDFDTRATLLSMAIEDGWEDDVKAQWRETKSEIVAGLVQEFGALHADVKIDNFVAIGAAPLSIQAFHNRFLRQARQAFVIGAYYPALTASCALGERILNHLVLALRDSFRGTPEYRRVQGKASFDKWDVPIGALAAWNALLPGVAERFRELAKIRNRSLHFDPRLDAQDRAAALDAITLLQAIIQEQFGAFGLHPWFIPDAPGVAFLKKDAAKDPFIREIYVPNCVLVGPRHRLESPPDRPGTLVVHDGYPYEDREVSDEEFVALFTQAEH